MHDRLPRSSAERKALRTETTINWLTNFTLNALCAWLIQRAHPFVPTDFWNVLLDILITSFCTCVLTTFFCAAAARRYLKAGVFAPRTGGGSPLCDLPRRPWLLGPCLAGLAGMPLGVLLGLGFTALRIPALPLAGFILYKGLFGGAIGACACAAVLRRTQIVREGERP